MSRELLPPPGDPYVEEPSDSSSASFWDHLSELRNRIVVVALAFLGTFMLTWVYREWLFAMFTRPVKEGLAHHGIYRLTALETTEAILVYLKMSAVASILVVIPVALWQLWLFVKPGLRRSEIRPLRRVVTFSLFMFVIGLLFAYRFVLPLVVDFLAGFTLGSGGVEFQVTMRSAYSTAFTFLVGFGVIFELPLVMILLAATPLISYRNYIKWIRYFIVIAFALGSLLTPPDVVSQVLMAVPLTVLYFIGIGFSYLMEKSNEGASDVRRGPDWILGIGVVGLAGLVVVMGLPSSVSPLEALPTGALQVTRAKPSMLPISCGAVSSLQALTLEEDGNCTCAEYEEGAVLIVEGAREGVDCDSLADFLEGEAPFSCEEVSGVWILGAPIPVARLLHNMDQGIVAPAPYSTIGEADWIFYRAVSLDSAQLSTYVTASLWVDPPVQEVAMAFKDPAEAEDFRELIEEHRDSFQKSASLSGDVEPTVAALLELRDAVRQLSQRCAPGDEEMAASLRTVDARLAVLTETLPGRHDVRGVRCETPNCVLESVAPLLPTDLEMEVKRRILKLSGELDGVEVVRRSEELKGALSDL